MPYPMQSASGYGGLDATPLARPGYYNEIIARVYERDYLPEITNSEIDEDIIQCHQQVQILKAPEVGPWRTLQKNQEMVPNQISAEAICLEICNAAYNDIKIDELDIRFACDRWDAWEEKFLDACYESWVEMQRMWVLSAMIMEASPDNKGAKAGQYKNVDLGSLGNPIVVNASNIALQFTKMQQVLTEKLRWRQGEMFILIPPAIKQAIVESNYANVMWTGAAAKPKSIGIDGLLDFQIAGFNLIETIHCPVVIDASGRVCYYILAGNREAYAYAADIINGRIVFPPRSFSAEYQMLGVWGGKMIYPEAVAVGYWAIG